MVDNQLLFSYLFSFHRICAFGHQQVLIDKRIWIHDEFQSVLTIVICQRYDVAPIKIDVVMNYFSQWLPISQCISFVCDPTVLGLPILGSILATIGYHLLGAEVINQFQIHDLNRG